MNAASESMPPPAAGAAILPWAAFHLLRLLMGAEPADLARMLGAEGFDAGFGPAERR
ncbi:hypothetical protein [Methylobacterium trifolii]|uniref:Uncharacterized protein n=1 Tax=Methylobacterium trifolii TaxID=1003092 RepID=A0ABQ4TSJ9_9HYPH|nr:hypothetical protein [Methylobacterium trifolii]GJE58165.1 hypothetical protein MPOCJGCO_0244 [Methylobacterium trifolii]